MNGQEVIATTGILPAKMHIHKWPKSERPREKLLERGAHALSDAELLAVLLRCGTRGRNAIELAQEHILAFGSLRELLTAEWPQWERRKDAGGVGGVGIARYAALQAGLELARRHLLEPLKVTYSVPVAIVKSANVHLINDRVFVPKGIRINWQIAFSWDNRCALSAA